MTTIASPPRPTAPTLGRELERHRLEHRAHRIEQVLIALRDRETWRQQQGHVPAPLRQAIRGFEDELAALRARIDATPC